MQGLQAQLYWGAPGAVGSVKEESLTMDSGLLGIDCSDVGALAGVFASGPIFFLLSVIC